MAWVSVQTAINVATSEYQNYLDVQKNAADETVKTADAQMELFRNLGNVSSEYAKKINATIKQIAAANNVPEANVFQVVKTARSSQGALTDDQMFANVAMATRLAPDKLSEQTALAGALNASSRLTGTADPKVNAGLLLSIGEQTRIEEMAQVSRMLIPAAAGIKATLKGTSTEEAMAMLTTMTTASEDESGSTSRTAGLQLAAQLRKFRNATDVGDEITALRNDPMARTKFLKEASFEVNQRPFIEDLLTPGTATAQLYDQNLPKVPVGDRASGVTDQFFQNVGQAPYQEVASQKRELESYASGLRLDNQRGAQISTIRKGMDEVLLAAGQGFTARTIGAKAFDIETIFGRDPRRAAADRIEEYSQELAGGRGQSKDTQETIATLQSIVAELRGLRTDNKNAPKKKNIDRNAEQ